MKIQRTLLAGAILLAYQPLVSAHAADDADPQPQTVSEGKIQQVVVTANPLRNGEGDQILTPAKVLAGDELRDKVGSSLGETLSQELGVSASAFGAGASQHECNAQRDGGGGITHVVDEVRKECHRTGCEVDDDLHGSGYSEYCQTDCHRPHTGPRAHD